MAGNDVAIEETEKKGVVVPAIAGVAGLAGGGILASRFIGGKDLDAKIATVTGKRNDAEEALKISKTEFLKDSGNITLYEAKELASDASRVATNNYMDVVAHQFEESAKTLAPLKQIDLAIEINKNALAHTQKGSPGFTALVERFGEGAQSLIDGHIADFNNRVEALKDLRNETNFTQLTPEDAFKAIKGIDPVAHAAGEYRKAAQSVLPKLDEEVMKVAAASTEYTIMTEAANNLKTAEAAYLPKLEAATAKEASTLKALESEAKQLTTSGSIIKETGGFKGAIKRPWKMLVEETGTNTKLAIVGASVALAATLYAGARALSGGKKESFADDVTQQRAANAHAAAAQYLT